MGTLFCRRNGLFPAQAYRGERRISPLGTNRVVSRSIDRRKRLPQSQDGIEALPPGGVKGALRTVGSGVNNTKALMPGGDRPRETAHVQDNHSGKRERGDI